MSSEIDHCIIWPDHGAIGRKLPSAGIYRVDYSLRAGGGYEILDSVTLIDSVSKLSDAEKARLTSWLIDQHLQGVSHPRITEDILTHLENSGPLPAHKCAERLLRFIAAETTQVGAYVDLSSTAKNSKYRTESAYAWSESIDWSGLYFYLNYLQEHRWVQRMHQDHDTRFTCRVTVDGYSRIEEQKTQVDSTQAFVAMWFDEKMNETYDKGIKLGIEAAGYKAMRIDRKEHANRIDDEIIAEIRRSRFLVADFTQGDDGARGGVYFEAGFAFGLNIPIIYTCREALEDKLSLDTRQYNHILWDTPESLKDALTKRIGALIGYGPLLQGELP